MTCVEHMHTYDDDDDEEDTIFNKTHSINIYIYISQFVVCQTKGEHLNRLPLNKTVTHFLRRRCWLSPAIKVR